MDVIDFFQLNEQRAEEIKKEVLDSVGRWEAVATKIGLSRADKQAMAAAFNV
jgi:serine/threonine-protein kinase HipA